MSHGRPYWLDLCSVEKTWLLWSLQAVNIEDGIPWPDLLLDMLYDRPIVTALDVKGVDAHDRHHDAQSAACVDSLICLLAIAGAAICEYVKDVSPAGVILMRHNIGVISRLFVGSVTRYCIENSIAPVIIVHPAVADT